ncbi:chromatin assembly factor 1 subunit B [Anthonomus grandis grandis]|uniref:chromatin assembly factor 1 subunit B n=1 Tax=Anthonomus grandis grandis TaxID=2921223 RepID=UPI002165D297|nr:chromatin assembly factor 1 subunit B [Anthonomus grandis grandis]
MKCTIPEISWHNKEPVLSVDIYPDTGDFYRLASGGGDCHVLIWQLTIAENGAVNQELISDLTRHQRAVNCVRWSPSGKYLASGDDDANIIIWHLKTDNIPLLEGDTGDKEIWLVHKILRGHKEDVYDICWSIDESKILSGSVDNTAILWDTNKGKIDHILSDHKGFVQGVAWDPKNRLISTISTDRVCRIFDPLGKQVKARIQKGKITSVPDSHFLKDKDCKYFHDDTFKSFFRRLQFSPDGSLLIVPSGQLETDNCKNNINATLVFTMDNFYCPSIILPIPKQSSTVVRCCPILYELREQGPDPIIKLPYRMVFAVGTDHDIILYDTQQTLPFARFQDIHYTRLTDLTWSQDGLLLIASSTDGFCSLITFELHELGVPWIETENELAEFSLNISGCEELDKDENVDMMNSSKSVKKEEPIAVKEEPKKRQSFLVQWALNTPKKKKIEDKKEISESSTANDNVIEILDSPEKKVEKMEDKDDVAVVKTPRKIKPIRVGDVTKSKPASTTTKPESMTQQKINILIPKRIPKPENNTQESQPVNVSIHKRITPITLASPKSKRTLKEPDEV